ncbi:MAG TPA: hypothetical protein VMO26_15220 [Vicinamibacterales bacterium]|nr:hypothetical protein [Vicinamibacterales bacterium]
MTVSFLHLVNGSSIVPHIGAAGIIGRIVSWDDVLHEGPVPAGLNIAAMRDTRAAFLAHCGWGSRHEIARSLAERDAALENLQRVDEIVLWFEHDLYDQLQILQILDRLPIDGGPRLTAVPDDDYLGYQPAARFGELFASRRDVTSSQRIAARDAWDAFRSADPQAIVDVLQRVTDLPHLPAALRRHLQQFPSTRNGLSRTEQQALEAVARGATLARDAFTQANHRSEEAIFMGDAAFLFHIRGLLNGPRPLVARADGPHQGPGAPLSLDDELELTGDGRRVLAGDADRVTLCGIDRWLGGVHLEGRGPVWRWHPTRATVVSA